jgi:esterase/lipase superfamily enzyme
MNERYIKWYTPWLSREFEMLAFGNDGGLPLIIFPTSFGSFIKPKILGSSVQSRAMSMLAKSPFIARTRSIWKVSTTRKFIRPIE